MPGLLLTLLILVPLIEIALFIQIGGALGMGWTLFLIVATALIGLSAVRRQGLTTLMAVQKAQKDGRAPLAEAAHGVLILLAGGFLLTPGFFTDAIGFFLLWPGGRRLVMETVLGHFLPPLFRQTGPRQGQQKRSARPQSPNIIEGQYRVDDDKQP